MNEWIWNGARWWKFDFHTHTPKSDDYGRGPQQDLHKQRTPKEWLIDYKQPGIDCVAITDHNTGAWIDLLKEALEELRRDDEEGFSGLHLFPGMEVSVHGGIHVLAIFDPSKATSDIDCLRGAIQYDGTAGQSDGVTRKSLVDVVKEIELANGIAIPAHVDEDNGLFKQQGTTLEQALDCENLFAVELVSQAFQKPQLYINKKLSWTEVIGSDSHQPNQGTRFTWVKMGAPTIEGLRLALLDGSLSVRRSEQEPGNPNQHASLVLESIVISKARYMGRSTPFALRFNPWLNAIIGGRGTGKSTIVEFMRNALRREEELPDTLKPEFDKYSKVYNSREDSGLLTNETEIAVVYRKNGSRYRVQWNPANNLDPIQEYVEGAWVRAEGEVQPRFPVRIYSQKQIFNLAKTPLALLRVVDESSQVDRRAWNERWKEEEGRFLSLRAKAREIEAGLTEESRLRGELDDVKRKLAVFEEAGHSEVLKSFQSRSDQKRAIETWEKEWADVGDRLRAVAGDLVPALYDVSSFDLGSQEDAKLHEIASATRGRIETIRNAMEQLSGQADEIVVEWLGLKDSSTWKQAVAAALQAYEELRQRLADEGAGDPTAYGELVQRRQVIEQRLREFGDRLKQVDELKTQADISLRRLLSLRQELTASRSRFLDEVLSSNRYVRIKVVPYGSRDTVEPEFRTLLNREGSGFERDIGSVQGGGILGDIYSSEQRDSASIEGALSAIKNTIRKIATGAHDPASLGDARFANHISRLQPEMLDRLDLWFPEDSLDVQYSTAGDGQNFRSIQEGSPGQKTAALLAFLLSYGDEPLMLDQPEDDLDNRLIYELIVTQLREVKQHRQVIVVTHNANIVVNGDAELVTALVVRNGETHTDCEGSLQEKLVRSTICDIMEGGSEAFNQRYRRIALERRG